MGARRSAGFALAVVGGLAIVGLLLRLPSVNDSLFGDELSTYYTVVGHSLRTTIHIVRTDQELTPPLYYALSWLATQLGNPTEALRLVSLLAGVATIPLIYIVGVRTVGVRPAVVAAALAALSPFLIFYSTEARAYALVTLLGLLSTLALLQALDDGRKAWWVAYAVFSCAAVYTHYTVVFLLAVQLLWALWTQPRARVALLAANGAAVIAFLPWLSDLRADQRSQCSKGIELLHPFSVSTLRMDVGRWAIGHPFIGIGTVPGWPASVLVVAGLATGFVGAVRRHRRYRPHPDDRLVLLAVLALALPVGAAIVSAVGTSVYLPRNLITSLPAFALVVGALVCAGRGIVGVVAAALVLAGVAIGAADMLSRQNQRPDYAAALRFVDGNARLGDVVVDAPFPTPGPLSAVDTAYARMGAPHPPVVRLGYPSVSTLLDARRPGGVGACASAYIPPPSGQAIARRAGREAPRGTIFLVTYALRRLAAAGAVAGKPLHQFLAALQGRYRLTQMRTFPGLGDHELAVYVLRREQR
jgi:4-amino-4-deoxy-L-arabinose transferase-like glycosyltransferase